MGMKFVLVAALLTLAACAEKAVSPDVVEVPPSVAKTESSGVTESLVSQEYTGGCWEKSCFSDDAQVVYLPASKQYELRRKDKKIGFLKLDIDVNAYEVEKLTLLKTASQFLVIYQISDGETGSGRVESFGLKDLAKRWTLVIPGFNIGFAASNNSLYVSCIDFIGKIDLKKGKYTWKENGLFKKYDYNGPDRIHVMSKEIHFISGTKVLKASPQTGKLIP